MTKILKGDTKYYMLSITLTITTYSHAKGSTSEIIQISGSRYHFTGERERKRERKNHPELYRGNANSKIQSVGNSKGSS